MTRLDEFESILERKKRELSRLECLTDEKFLRAWDYISGEIENDVDATLDGTDPDAYKVGAVKALRRMKNKPFNDRVSLIEEVNRLGKEVEAIKGRAKRHEEP